MAQEQMSPARSPINKQAFWKTQFANAPDPFFLEQQPAKTAPLVFDTVYLPLEAAAWELLSKYSDKREMEHFVLLVTALCILFSRYADTDAVTVYTASLQEADVAGTGVLLPLFLEINDLLTVQEQVAAVNEIILNAFAHQDEAEGIQDGSSVAEKRSNVLIVSEALHSTIERNAFDVAIILPGSRMQGSIGFVYNRQLFNDDFAEHCMQHLAQVIGQFAAAQMQTGNIDVITSAERHTLIYELNQTVFAIPAQKTVVDIFEQQAAAQPYATAVSTEEGTWTYAEIAAGADKLAAHLQSNFSIGKGSRVGVMLDKSAEAIIALLAILKSGAVYVPIDIAQPYERVRYMLGDAAVSLLITNTVQLQQLEKVTVPLFAIDVQMDAIPAATLPCAALPHDIAYIIYTSGSTGNPKGVMLQHDGLLNTALHHIAALPMQSSDRYLQFMSFSFDGALLDIFSTLLCGAALIVPSREVISEPAKFLAFVAEKQVTIFTITPTYLSALQQAAISSVHTIISAGEPAIREDAVYYASRKKVFNGYGPSEITVNATLYEVPADLPPGRVPIGKPAANKQAYITDRKMRLMPRGFAGELCIAGVGVAKGYLNDNALTDAKFIANPFDVHGKLYRSGDRAQWLPDGNLTFCGRRDDQVKLNGFRIDLGEISQQLKTYPGIKDAVAYVQQYSTGARSLAAFYTMKETLETVVYNDAGIISFLATVLPAYMLPAMLAGVPQFPVTINGKTDKAQLLLLANGQDVHPKRHEEPQTPVEMVMAGIWEHVLGRKEVSRTADFFQLGGDSIKAIQIVSRLLKSGYKLDVKSIFDKPVLWEVSALAVLQTNMADQATVTGSMPCTPIQLEVLLGDAEDRHHYNQALMLFSGNGFGQAHTEQVFSKLIKHHDALRIVLEEDNGHYLLRHMPETQRPDCRFYDLQNVAAPSAFIEAEAAQLQRSIDLQHGPLLRVAVFHGSHGGHLLLVVHHLVVDSVSMRIIMEDITALFEQALAGQPLDLPLKTHSFKKWAEGLQQYANSKNMLKERAYWGNIAALQVPLIPKDFVAGSDLRQDAQKVSFALGEELTAALLTRVNSVFNTEINDILLTGLMLSLDRTLGFNRTLVALEGHGREDILPDINISRTVGWFTTTYPLFLQLSAPGDLQLSIKEVKEQLRKVPHKGIGYGILKHLTAPANKQGYLFTHAPQIGFNYLGQFDTDLDHTTYRVPTEQVGETQSLRRQRLHDIEISGLVANAHLQLSLSYNRHHFAEETIAAFASAYQQALTDLILFCSNQEAPTQTPSDFTFKGLSIDDLDAIFS